MSLDIERFRKIQNSNGVNSKIEKQILDIKQQEIKHFHDTHGTQNVIVITNDYDENHKLITKEQDLIIIKQSDLDLKKIIVKPNEEIKLGDIIKVYNTHYLVTQIDANDTIHIVAKMKRCNICLKWQNSKGKTITSYGVLSDAVASSTGIKDANVITTVDSKSIIWLPLNDDTVILQRDKRLIIELFESDENGIENERNNHFKDLLIKNNCTLQVYQITKRNSVEKNYDGYGYISFTYKEVAFNPDTDRDDLLLCDYIDTQSPNAPVENPTDNGRCEITYKGNCEVKSGGSLKKFTAKFYDMNSNEIDYTTVRIKWDMESYFDKTLLNPIIQDDYIGFKFDNDNLIGEKFRLKLSDEDGIYGESNNVINIISIY